MAFVLIKMDSVYYALHFQPLLNGDGVNNGVALSTDEF